jgi:hypothetical protein
MFDGAVFGRELAIEIKRVIAPLNDEIRTLKARVAELEAAVAQKLPVKYLGVYRPGAQYSAGSIITRDGSMFHANKLTTEAPGDGCADWTLCVKHGRDGRDVNARR